MIRYVILALDWTAIKLNVLSHEETLESQNMRSLSHTTGSLPDSNVLTLIILLGFLLITTSTRAAEVRGKVITDASLAGAQSVNIRLFSDSTYTGIGTDTDINGDYHILSVPIGTYEVHFDLLGYKSEVKYIDIVSDSVVILDIRLNPESVSLPGVSFAITSVSKHEVTILNSPIRTEVMVPEEVQDKIAFSTSVDGALRYSGGVVVNTSKNIYESENLRFRGMDSNHLLLLSDQLPILGYRPEGIGLSTIPLVSIKQLEIVKGDYSALYGYGNAGLINIVTRTPFSDSLSFFGLTRGDMENDRYAGFYTGRRFGSFGLSTVVSGNSFGSVDGSSINQYVFKPRIDYRPSRNTTSFVAGTFLDTNEESLNLDRYYNITVGSDNTFNNNYMTSIKGQYVAHTATTPPEYDRKETEKELGYLSANVTHNGNRNITTFGMDGYSEYWKIRNSPQNTNTDLKRMSLFMQDEWTTNSKWSLLYAGRITNTNITSSGPYEYHTTSDNMQYKSSKYNIIGQNYLLSVLWKPLYLISYRITGSYGDVPLLSHYIMNTYDNISIFTPSREMNPEKNLSASIDMRMINKIGGYWWTGNISFFVVRMQDHIDIYSKNDDVLQTVSALTNKSFVMGGGELFFRLDLGDDAAILLGYTLLLPENEYDKLHGTALPIPQSQANFEIDWEIESTGLRVELESKVVSEQNTPNNPYRTSSPPYVGLGMTIEYTVGSMKIFGGAENMTGFVQNDAGPLWGPREGRQIYVGLKTMF